MIFLSYLYVLTLYVEQNNTFNMIDLKEELRYVNKDKIEEISELTKSNTELLNNLIAVSLGDDEYISQHAALIVKEIGVNRPEDIEDNIEDIISALLVMENDSQLGSFVEMFSLTDIKVFELQDFLIKIIQDETRQAFLKIYCIKLLGNFARIDDARTAEIIKIIEDNFKYYTTYYIKKNANELLASLKGEAPKEKKSVFC